MLEVDPHIEEAQEVETEKTANAAPRWQVVTKYLKGLHGPAQSLEALELYSRAILDAAARRDRYAFADACGVVPEQ